MVTGARLIEPYKPSLNELAVVVPALFVILPFLCLMLILVVGWITLEEAFKMNQKQIAKWVYRGMNVCILLTFLTALAFAIVIGYHDWFKLLTMFGPWLGCVSIMVIGQRVYIWSRDTHKE
jgi:CDP-diglyceride synthetase